MTPNEHAIADSAKILEIALSDEDSPAATLARRHWLKTRAGVSVKTADRVNHESFKALFSSWHNSRGPPVISTPSPIAKPHNHGGKCETLQTRLAPSRDAAPRRSGR